MGSGKNYDLHEVFKDSSSQQMLRHQQTIQAFLDRGYKIESQEKEEDLTAGGDLVAMHLTTVLKPTENFELPMLKLEASEVFGRYFDQEDDFYPHDEPEFKLKMHKKSSGLRAQNDRWMPFDL
ncbi:MAG: hypothetical protein Q8P95_01350 [bacterium]|nr:hypothetical protein [bacterium]